MTFTTREPTPAGLEHAAHRVDQLGGESAGICRGHDLVYQVGTDRRLVHSCCCGGETLAQLPVPGTGDRATVCFVCDAATEFPRLK